MITHRSASARGFARLSRAIWLGAAIAVAVTAGVRAAPPPDAVARALSTVAAAPGAGLFKANGLETQAAAPETFAQGPILRRRLAAIDGSYLAAMMAASDVVVGADGQVNAQAAAFTLNLMPDVTVHVVKQQATIDELGDTVWQGTTVEGADSVTLIIHDGLVTGEVRLGAQKFGIAPTSAATGNTVHAVVEYRQSAQWQQEKAVKPPIKNAPASSIGAPGESAPSPGPRSALERPAATTPSISIYIAYTAAALKLKPDMQGAISLALADLRTTLSNSQITATVTLAGSTQTSYVELDGESSDSVLNDAQIGAGDFARVRQAQQAANADILSVWSAYKDNCGLAGGQFYDGDPAAVDLVQAALASVNTISADCGADTFTHEVGHLLGANHERYIVSNAVAGPKAYNYGYTDLGHFRDVMAYGNECQDKGQACPSTQYFSNPNVTYQGRPMGVADSQAGAADNSRKITEVLPYAALLHSKFAAPTTPVLSISRSGNGTVSDSAGGLTCGTACNSALSSGTSDTLTAVADPGWTFTGWSGGGCSGTASTCTVTISANVTVTATFAQSTTVQIGAIYSSAQPSSQSFLRLYNGDTAAGTATVALRDGTTGTVLGRWTSPSITPGVERQFAIADIESGASPTIGNKPQFYTISVDSQFAGYVQHVLWHVSDNSLTNLTTCSSGAKADAARLVGVHSTLLGSGYPSSIVVYNAGNSTATVTLGIYDALTANRLGTFNTDPISASGGEKIYSVSAIEKSAVITPGTNMYHYVVKPETSLNGHIAHLVQNVQAGVFTDMSTVCPLRSVANVGAVSTAQQAAVFSSAQAGSQSFLRFLNTGSNYGTVNVSLIDPNTGNVLAQWTSSNITAGAGIQVPITTIEAAATSSFTKPDFYTVTITGSMIGEFQHVLWHASDGTLTNLTTCDAGTHNNAQRLGAVHTSHIGAQGYPSSIVVTNTGTAPTQVSLDIADAADATKLGTYQTASIPAGGQVIVPVTDIENGASPKIVAGNRSHYVITAASAFSGYLQHQVNNTQVGVITDMTATCRLQP